MRVDSSDAASGVDPPGLDARVLARGLAALRIFIGLIALLNGLAKVFGWHRVQLGPYLANLINRDDARFILDLEVFKNPANSSTGTRLPLVRSISQLMLDHWGLVGWALTVTEVVTGLLLVLGSSPGPRRWSPSDSTCSSRWCMPAATGGCSSSRTSTSR